MDSSAGGGERWQCRNLSNKDISTDVYATFLKRHMLNS